MLGDSGGGTLGGLLVLGIILGVYFLPTIIASQRGVTNLGSIAVINIFLGWTLVGVGRCAGDVLQGRSRS